MIKKILIVLAIFFALSVVLPSGMLNKRVPRLIQPSRPRLPSPHRRPERSGSVLVQRRSSSRAGRSFERRNLTDDGSTPVVDANWVVTFTITTTVTSGQLTRKDSSSGNASGDRGGADSSSSNAGGPE
ncbi:MAG: hypothetical protein ACLU7D_01695 [Collinsella sp.]